MIIEEALRSAGSRFAKGGSDTAALDASLLLSFVTGKERLELFAYNEKSLTEEETSQFETLVKRREAGEPIAYIMGEKEFWGLPFKVKPGVLIPRPDTETMIATLCALLPDRKAHANVADLGVGSGAIIMSLLNEFPQFVGYGVDMSDTALAVTKENAEALGVADRLTLYKGSWCEPLTEEINIIVSNPPYITTEEMDGLMQDVKDYEPTEALHAGQDGLDCYETLIPQAYEKLAEGGLLMLEIGSLQNDAVTALMQKQDWADVRSFKDLAGRDRVVIGVKK